VDKDNFFDCENDVLLHIENNAYVSVPCFSFVLIGWIYIIIYRQIRYILTHDNQVIIEFRKKYGFTLSNTRPRQYGMSLLRQSFVSLHYQVGWVSLISISVLGGCIAYQHGLLRAVHPRHGVLTSKRGHGHVCNASYDWCHQRAYYMSVRLHLAMMCEDL
jgi:hypothetical protein